MSINIRGRITYKLPEACPLISRNIYREYYPDESGQVVAIKI